MNTKLSLIQPAQAGFALRIDRRFICRCFPIFPIVVVPVAFFAASAPVFAAAPSTSPFLRVLVVDKQTGKPVPFAFVRVETGDETAAAQTVRTNALGVADVAFAGAGGSNEKTLVLPVETGVVLQAAQTSAAGPPVKDIYVKVTASRLPQARAGVNAAAAVRTKTDLQTFTNKTSGSAATLTQGQSGVASDSNGQQHIRGEHADIAFVVDGVPLPDTLSGRQGSVVRRDH